MSDLLERKKKMREQKLYDRDQLVIEFLYKFRVAEIKTIQIILGNINYVSVTKRLKKLYDNDYLIRYRKDVYTPYMYSLSYKSLYFFGDNKVIYNFFSQNTEYNLKHSLLGALILRDNLDLLLSDLKTEKELLGKELVKSKKRRPKNIPKIIFSNNDLAIDFLLRNDLGKVSYREKLNDFSKRYNNKYTVFFYDEYLSENYINELEKIRFRRTNFIPLSYINKDNEFLLDYLMEVKR